MDSRRVAELHNPHQKSGGTGYLIRDNIILTAHHNIAPLGQPGILGTRYHIRFIGDYLQGRIDWIEEACCLCWDAPDPKYDLALLKLSDKPKFLSSQEPVICFGKILNNTLSAEGFGFPLAQEIKNRQNPEPLEGRLSRIAGIKEGQLRLQVTSPIPDSPNQWQGISGTALFVDDFLVGVVVETNKSFGEKLLWATPISSVATDKEFCELVLGESNKSLFLEEIETNVINQPSRSSTALSKGESELRQNLLKLVKNQWVKPKLADELEIIQLCLEEIPEAISQEASNYLSQESSKELQKTKVIDLFDENNCLLILGEAGSGKSITLMELTNTLITRASDEPEEKIPVIFYLSSWSNGKDIRDWLIERLDMDYKVPEEDGKLLVDDNKLVILLDGLDLVPSQDRDRCIDFLNNFTDIKRQIVVCSRCQQDQKYSNNSLLNFDKAVKLKPLTEEKIESYLKKLNKDNRLDGLKEIISQDNTIKGLVKLPLWLSIIVKVYNKDIFNRLLQEDNISIKLWKKKLFEQYISYIYSIKNSHIKYLDKASKYSILKKVNNTDERLKMLQRKTLTNLTWLAQKMQSEKYKDSIFFIENMQPNWLDSRTQKQDYYFGVLLISGLFSSLIGFVHIPLQPVDNWKYTLCTGLLGGFCVPLFYVWDYLFRRNQGKEINPANKLVWSWGAIIKNLRQNWSVCFLIGLVVALPSAWLEVHGIIDLYKSGIEKNIIRHLDSINLIALVLIYTLLVAAIIWLVYGFTANLAIGELSSQIDPNQGIWNSLRNTQLVGLIAGIIIGLIFFLVGLFVQKHPMVSAIKYGIGYGLIAGWFLAICSSSGKTCIKHFALRLILYKNKLIPWNYAQFLDYASQIVLLQKSGGGYQFFHQEFQEYLTERSKKSAIKDSDS
ncbi:hypothetical protein LC605_05575 [Nostoc sp. CHAB 5836]|uniref:NACHT domain-containing protein n=1 Tax=Nostoc sp. CHAB 5836 TaxID=2780404 RepID=UPI001E3196B7|nr:hypothetical protein [Nostoc sp. CHAB 5836]MCC5614555.1 hypothetical protein [Nostoc sp. CHAB 5836]